MEIKKRTLLIILAGLVMVAFGTLAAYSSATQAQPNNAYQKQAANPTQQGGVQYATLSFENYEYKMEPAVLKAGVPVRLEVDLKTVYGCMRDVVINDFGVRKYVSEGNNIIEFTPDKTGTFWVVCSMNMGRGQFTVTEDGNKDSAATAPNQKETATAEQNLGAGYCGAAGQGGCGCSGYRAN